MQQTLTKFIGRFPLIRKQIWGGCLLVFSFLVAGCGFVVEEHITGPYYLVGVDDDKDLSVSYDLKDGNYIGRVPETVVEVGFNDSLLIARAVDANNKSLYYIIDRKKDHAYAKEEEYLVAVMSAEQYRWAKDSIPVRLEKVDAGRR